MEIRGILNKMILTEEKNQNKVSFRKENSKGDIFEISKDAKELIQKTKNQQLQQIRERIENNFYSSDEVLSRVAEKILNEIKF